MNRSGLILLAVALVFGTAPFSSIAGSPGGSWRGEWSSETTGHRGPLRARIRQIDADRYRALFAGRFAKIVPFVYPATLHRVPGSHQRYSSETRLPLLGTYRMSAFVTGNHFSAGFTGRRDRGRFEMRRR